MTDKINAGGPAFPTLMKAGDLAVAEGGMTLRDYLAAKADLRGLIEQDGFIPGSVAVSVMGCQPPNDAGVVARTQWWFEAEARIRYMKADAMLRVREGS